MFLARALDGNSRHLRRTPYLILSKAPIPKRHPAHPSPHVSFLLFRDDDTGKKEAGRGPLAGQRAPKSYPTYLGSVAAVCLGGMRRFCTLACKRPLLFKGNKAKIKEEDEVKLEPGEAHGELWASD